ncbi:pyrimidine reductase family protein [Herbiconiux sp. KACC 21604]|uniref:pyrimidine reductase family protein n=1 Tax=unclassified Herbiconiux TaxID=2618217 RepID=UPI00149198E7|nr:pyrimidine reductase family protein [Herbiconiux sp. SALV-R1]QJU53234.1 pyrimidine reductase family protein [Herbiconiux sp. SALV-R1]WPO88192.1 pyrimidine reductase family protein [Herbiconiux sp. KACC 21604]
MTDQTISGGAPAGRGDEEPILLLTGGRPDLGGGALDDDALWSLYDVDDRATGVLRVNFVQSLDGSATVDGLSGGLGGPADKRVFDTLRSLADVVLVGAGTARDEGYGALRVSAERSARRVAAGLPAQPAMALVSGRLSLDPGSDLFAVAPRRPLVFTVEAAPADARARLSEVADVVDVGTDTVDPARIVAELTSRGHTQVLCEGGPSLFGDLVAADLVDEFCLTLSPLLEGGHGPRVITAPTETPAPPRGLELGHVLRSGSTLLTRWRRPAGTSRGGAGGGSTGGGTAGTDERSRG